MTDSQHSSIENKGERIYPPEDEGAISCPSDDETPHRKKSTSRRKAPPPTGKRRARSGKADKHPKPITPKRPAPEPKTSPIIVKAHGRRQDLARFDPSKMYQKTAYASLAIELEGAIHTESNLIPNAIPEPFDLSDILKQLTHLGPGRARVPRASRAKRILYRYSAVSEKWMDWPPTNETNTEDQLGKYLNEVADDVRTLLGKKKSEDDLMFSHQFRHSGLDTVSTTVRKPDLVVIPRSDVGAEGLHWKDFRSAVSLKIGSQTQKDEREQLSEYARICFEEQYDRRYFIAFGLRDTKLTFYVFDRSGILQSEEHDVHKEPLVFLRVAIRHSLLR